MMTAGAFFALVLILLFPGVGAALGVPSAFVLMPIAMAVTALFAVGLDRLFYRPMREAGVRPVVMVMTSIGVMLMLQGLIRIFAGTDSRQLYVSTDGKDIYRIPFGGRDIVMSRTTPTLRVSPASRSTTSCARPGSSPARWRPRAARCWRST
jgi:branched-chain amino acid transport system permease protein